MLPTDDLRVHPEEGIEPGTRTYAQIQVHPGRRTNNSIRIVLCDKDGQPHGILTIGEDIIRWAPAEVREVTYSHAEFARLLDRRY